jgi:hypothetical protein
MKGTCGECIQRIGEECGITGSEVYEDDVKDCCEPRESQETRNCATCGFVECECNKYW